MTGLKDGTLKEGRVEAPDGEKDFDVTALHGCPLLGDDAENTKSIPRASVDHMTATNGGLTSFHLLYRRPTAENIVIVIGLVGLRSNRCEYYPRNMQ